jgi:glycosyltransferase involved in cell wall biosynthesis
MAHRVLRVQNRRDTAIRIGIDALAWNRRTGYGRYCRELVSALLLIPTRAAPTRYSFTLLMDSDTCAPAGADVVRFASARSAGGPSARSLRELLALAWTIARTPVDAWFFPSPLTFVPVVSRARPLVAIHDTIPWRYPRFTFGGRAQQLAWRLKLGLAIRQTARVITVSNHARESLVHSFGMDDSAIRVIGEAPAAVFKPNLDPAEIAALAQRIGLPPEARTIVYHGAFAPHKDLRTLVGAFARLCRRPEFRDVHLVLAGSIDGANCRTEHRSLKAMCQGLERVRFPGSLDDGDLALLLNHATLAVLPSLDEGFGLTGLEAVACGAPLIATRSSALPELLGDAAWYFEPGDENELCAHLAGLLAGAGLRRTLRERGLERIATLSWAGAARRLLAVFDEVLAGLSG